MPVLAKALKRLTECGIYAPTPPRAALFPNSIAKLRAQKAAPSPLAVCAPQRIYDAAQHARFNRFCQGSRHCPWPTRAVLTMSRLSQRGVDEDAVLGL